MAETNKQIVEKVNASFAENKPEGFLSYCADDVKWTMVGEKSVTGKEAVREWMKSMEGTEPPKFTVDTLIAEGDSVACCGDMTMKDKDGATAPYGYCDVYRFRDGKISELTSYVVKTAEQSKEAGTA